MFMYNVYNITAEQPGISYGRGGRDPILPIYIDNNNLSCKSVKKYIGVELDIIIYNRKLIRIIKSIRKKKIRLEYCSRNIYKGNNIFVRL